MTHVDSVSNMVVNRKFKRNLWPFAKCVLTDDNFRTGNALWTASHWCSMCKKIVDDVNLGSLVTYSICAAKEKHFWVDSEIF